MDEDMLNQALGGDHHHHYHHVSMIYPFLSHRIIISTGFKSSRKRQYSDTLEVDEVKQLMAKGDGC